MAYELADRLASMEVDTKNNPDKRDAAEKNYLKVAQLIVDLKDEHTDPATAGRIAELADILRKRAHQLTVAAQ